MLYCGRVILNGFILVDIKRVRCVSRAQRPLTTGIVRRQFSSLRGTTWRSNVSSPLAKRLSLRAWYSCFRWRISTFTGWNWKCSVIIVMQTDLSGFRARAKNMLNPGADRPVSHAPSRTVTTNLSRTGLDPLKLSHLQSALLSSTRCVSIATQSTKLVLFLLTYRKIWCRMSNLNLQHVPEIMKCKVFILLWCM